MEVNSDVLYLALEEDVRDASASSDVAAQALQKAIFKKYEDESSDKADQLALEKFISVNERCKRFTWDRLQEWEYEMLGELRAHLYHFFHPTSVGHILDFDAAFKHATAGPGASIGARGEDFYTKHFDSTLTYTHESRFLPELYARQTSNSSWWLEAEFQRNNRHGFRCVPGSSISTVPKNVDISRTICTEPSLLMFYQLGMAGIMKERLREWGLNIDSQAPLNRELARVGSLDGTFGTIDLASASDSLSVRMLRAVLPQDVFATLWCLRCSTTRLPGGRGDCELHMLSTMGNGYTFPLQTVLFTCVVLSVYKCLGIQSRKTGRYTEDNWAVFGDDIIVRREAYRWVVRILELLGFEVNTEKSFNEGPFRESCGADWHSGVDVRGVYCKTLKSVGSRFSLINRLIDWSSRHRIPLIRTVHLLLGSVPVVKVPFLESEDAGVRVPSNRSVCLRTTAGMTAYVKYAKSGPKLKVSDGLVTRTPRKRGSKTRSYNEYGFVVAMLHGSYRDGIISLRADARFDRYRRCRGYIHFWDSLMRVPSPDQAGWMCRIVPVLSPGDWQTWSTFVDLHLESVQV